MTEREFIYSAIVCAHRRRRRQKYTLCRHITTGLTLKRDGWLNDGDIEQLKQALIDKIFTIYDVVTDDNGQMQLVLKEEGNEE